MSWSPNYVEDGDHLTAVRIDGLFTDAQTWLTGGVTALGLQRGTFNYHHATSVLTPNGEGYTVVNTEDSNIMDYTWATFGASIQWATFGQNGGSGDSGDLGSGDRAIVGHESTGYSGDKAQIDFPAGGFHVGVDNGDMVAAILLLFNGEISQAAPGWGAFSATHPEAAIVFSIQYQADGSGTWHTIKRSERFASVYDHASVSDETADAEEIDYDVPIISMLTEAQINADLGDASAHKISSIRAMVTSYDFQGVQEMAFVIRNFRLTALPLLMKDED